MKAELRYYSGLEIRSNGSGSRTVVGYALKFNVLSQNLGGFYEKIDSRSLEGADLSDVVALFNHDNNLILSRTASNTLKLTPDSIGLRYEFEAPNTTAGNDLLESIKRGDITGSSFSFIVAKGGDTWDNSGQIPVRTILKFSRIIDVSPVVFPSYKDTEVYRRALESIQEVRSIRNNQQNIIIKDMEKRKTGILDVVRQSITGEFTPEVNSVIKRGQELAKQSNISVSKIVLPMEARAITAGQSGLINDEVLWDFVSPIRNENVLVKAGAKFIPDCISNFKVPVFNGCACNWEAENDQAGDGSNTFGAVEFIPKRLTATVTVSKQLLFQTAGNAEQLITNDIVQAINSKIEETVFGKHAAADKIPNGFFTGVADEDLFTSGVIDTGKLLDMAYSLTKAGQDSRAWVINEAGEKYFKKYLDTTRSKYVLEGGKIWEYPVFVTNNIPSGLTADEAQQGIIFGNWSQYLLANFGVLDIVVDPFSKAISAAVEITVNSYWDLKPRNAGAFAVGAFTVS